MCHREIWKETHTNTNFSRKSDLGHSHINWPNFKQNHPIFPNFLKFSNLGKFWKIDPFIYQILHFIKGHPYTKRLILLHMLVAHPCRVFCTGYPPGRISKRIHCKDSPEQVCKNQSKFSQTSYIHIQMNYRRIWRFSSILLRESIYVLHKILALMPREKQMHLTEA